MTSANEWRRNGVYAFRMRRSLIALALVSLVVVSAAQAAALDPARLVLRRGEIPGDGWTFSPGSGYRTVAQAAQGAPAGTAARFRAAGFQRGYDISWGAKDAFVGSTAYVFATATGAKRAFQVYRETAPQGTKRIPFKSVGDASLAFRSKQSGKYTAIVWLNGRVLSILLTGGLEDKGTLGLARIQAARAAKAIGR